MKSFTDRPDGTSKSHSKLNRSSAGCRTPRSTGLFKKVTGLDAKDFNVGEKKFQFPGAI
jgi:hypothetical protein